MAEPVTIEFTPEPIGRETALRLILSRSSDPEAFDNIDCHLEYRDADLSVTRQFVCSAQLLERFRTAMKRLASGEVDTAVLFSSDVQVIIHVEYDDPDDCSVQVQFGAQDTPHHLILIRGFWINSLQLLASCRHLRVFLRSIDGDDEHAQH